MKAWHFIAENKRLGYGHNETVAPGYVYSVEGQIELCRWGMHASIQPLDALSYAPGPIICRVELGGEILKGDDKVVAQTREVTWMADATNTLHEFACQVAERALRDAAVEDARSWAAINAKRKWLAGEITYHELGAAMEAAWDAARAAARADARATARTAARAAARADARTAAWHATWDAMRQEHNKLLTKMLNELK